MTTFVTGFFNLRRVDDPQSTNFEQYFAALQVLLDTPINLILYTTADIVDKLQYTARDNLQVVALSSMPYQHLVPEITATWGKYITNNAPKDTPAFAAMCLSKFALLLRAMRDNPFQTDHFAWIDAGLSLKVHDWHLLPSLTPSDKVKIMHLNPTNTEEVNLYQFVHTCRYKCAAGLFTGHRKYMRKYCLKVIETARHYLDLGHFGLEQEFMAIVCVRYPQWITAYYGDFWDLVGNYTELTRSQYIADKFH